MTHGTFTSKVVTMAVGLLVMYLLFRFGGSIMAGPW